MVFDDQVDNDTGDLGRVGFIVFFVTLAIVAGVCAFIVFMPGVMGWEEQLEGCRIRGIPIELCPDDESYVGVPYTPPAPTMNSVASPSSDGRTTRTRQVWVFNKILYGDENRVCYSTYKRVVQHYRGGVTMIKDYPLVVMQGCVTRYEYPINVVLK